MKKWLNQSLKILGGFIVAFLVIVFPLLFIKYQQSEKNLQHPEFYSEKFNLVYKWELIPSEVRDEIKNELPGRVINVLNLHHVQFRMADPGESFNETDVNEDPKLPYQRIIFAGVSPNASFIYYQTGGLEQASRMVVLKKTGSKYAYDWSVWVPRKFNYFYSLKLMMRFWPDHFPITDKGQF